MDMADDFAVALFQFIFVNPDTGLHGTALVAQEHGDVWDSAKLKWHSHLTIHVPINRGSLTGVRSVIY